ncbi:MAG: hypothetical protein IPQ07_23595 [Myxococcales bacterium]|nr:hypothetical protein [Myxococcales bacterium]
MGSPILRPMPGPVQWNPNLVLPTDLAHAEAASHHAVHLGAFPIAALLVATTSPVIAGDEVPPRVLRRLGFFRGADASLFARALTHFSRGEYAQAKLLRRGGAFFF